MDITLVSFIFSILSFVLLLIILFSKNKRKDLQIILEQNNQTRLELNQKLENQRIAISQQLNDFDNRIFRSISTNELNNSTLSKNIDIQLEKIKEDNLRRLESIKELVDSKLENTLDNTLSKSFKLISGQLEKVYISLGEINKLSSNVDDLSNLLGNIKIRGVWGEVQAQNIISQILSPWQWEKNVATVKNSTNRVEFAVKMPGKNNDYIYLPIDAKFPKEDYERLQIYYRENKKEEIEKAIKALSSRIENEAKSISQKYLDPPNTTNFAILFLPIEGLYAEVLNIPGLFDKLLNQYKVILSGPTTFSALLNSLQMGFRTLAIEKKSEEVWNILASIKTEFKRFDVQLSKVQLKLNQASNSLNSLETRTRVMNSKLNIVDEIEKT